MYLYFIMDAYILGGRASPPGVNVHHPFSLMGLSLHILEEANMEVSRQRRHVQVRYQRRENLFTIRRYDEVLAVLHLHGHVPHF